MIEDIRDHLEENVIDENLVVVEDVDSCIKRIEALRSQYRSLVKDYKGLVPTDVYAKSDYVLGKEVLMEIKRYILLAKERRSAIRRTEN